MLEEYGLMIIWKNALFCKDKIIKDVKKRFELVNQFEIEWSKDKFAENLSRFYGENLPKNSFKEKHCGNGNFILLILKDKNPIYKFRKTSKGKKMVNVNFFDSKELYRNWTGSHMIHATNDVEEFKHDLMLLLGVNVKDYEERYLNKKELIYIKQDIIGDSRI